MKYSALSFLLLFAGIDGFVVSTPQRTRIRQSSAGLHGFRDIFNAFGTPSHSIDKRRSPLARLITDQLLGSAMIYTVASVRAYVRETEDKLDWYLPELILTQQTTTPNNRPPLLFMVLRARFNQFWDQDAERNKDPLEYENFLQYPITAARMSEFLSNEKNKQLLFEADQVEEFNPDTMTDDSTKSETDVFDTLERFIDSEVDIVEFDDQFSRSQLVYALTVNKRKRRLTVCFRGSVFGGSDWPTNLSFFPSAKIKTPSLIQDLGFDGDICLHPGFNSYLNQEKFDSILGQILKQYKNPLYKGYELYLSGHRHFRQSLGGGLAALLGFRLAASEELLGELKGKPIKVISFASPQVGNDGYVKAFRTLEDNGYIQHIRVSSQGDFVPVSPSLGGYYRQTGINLHLHKKEAMEVGRTPVRYLLSQLGFNNPLKMHELGEYRRRLKLDANRAIMYDAKTTNGLYKQNSQA